MELNEQNIMYTARLASVRARLTDSDYERVLNDDLDETEALARTREWLAGNKPVLVLSGTVGTGKTVAAAWALRGASGVFLSVNRVIRLFSNRFDREVLRSLDHAIQSDLLVIDDIGAEGPTRHAELLLALNEIVDARRSTRNRTLLSTNLTVHSLKRLYPDARLHSRLAQSAMVCEYAGDDMRRGQ